MNIPLLHKKNIAKPSCKPSSVPTKIWSKFECQPQNKQLAKKKNGTLKINTKKKKEVKFFEVLLKNFCIFCILSPDPSRDYSLLFSIMQRSFITMHTWKYLKLALLLLKELHECRGENREKLLIQERRKYIAGTRYKVWGLINSFLYPLPLPSDTESNCL